MNTLAESVRLASRVLEGAGWDASSAWLDAEVLARSILQWDLADWLSRQDQRAGHSFQAAFDAAVARRVRHEPVAYITGEREFYGRSFAVSPAVLIPRPETELVVEAALAALHERLAAGVTQPRIVDVGTGTGILAATLAIECPAARVVATDISTDALAVAAGNVRRLGADPRIELRQASLLGEDAHHAFDLVMSNPPYVAERDRSTLMADVRDYEPAVALFGGPDGLDVIRALLPAAEHGLRPGGWLIVEIGAGQAAAVSRLLERSTALGLLRIAPDLAGIPRVLIARRPER